MSALNRPPEEVLQPSRLPDYKKRMRIFWDELITLHTNLSLTRQIADFNFRLFQAPAEFFVYTSRNLISQCVLIITRLWGDKRKETLTLDKFGAWLVSAVRSQYKNDVEGLLQVAQPSRELENFIESLRAIRHAEVAHLNLEAKLGFRTRPKPLNLGELQRIADCLGSYYNNINFNAESMFIPVNFLAEGGRFYEGQLGYIFDRLALDSKWFRIPEEHPSAWPRYKAKLSPEELEEVNGVAKRHRRELP